MREHERELERRPFLRQDEHTNANTNAGYSPGQNRNTTRRRRRSQSENENAVYFTGILIHETQTQDTRQSTREHTTLHANYYAGYSSGHTLTILGQETIRTHESQDKIQNFLRGEKTKFFKIKQPETSRRAKKRLQETRRNTRNREALENRLWDLSETQEFSDERKEDRIPLTLQQRKRRADDHLLEGGRDVATSRAEHVCHS